MASTESVLDYLWSIAPDGATNGEIARRLAISSHQVAFMVTRDLFRRGLVRAERTGRTWMFYALEEQLILPARRATLASDTSSSGGVLLPAAFEGLARRSGPPDRGAQPAGGLFGDRGAVDVCDRHFEYPRASTAPEAAGTRPFRLRFGRPGGPAQFGGDPRDSAEILVGRVGAAHGEEVPGLPFPTPEVGPQHGHLLVVAERGTAARRQLSVADRATVRLRQWRTP